MNVLFEALDAARPASPGSRYAMGYDDGLSKAKSIIKSVGFVSYDLYKKVIAERNSAIAYIEDHGIQFGSEAPDVVRVVRCINCRFYDPNYGYCLFWHGARPAGHYCKEGERPNDA